MRESNASEWTIPQRVARRGFPVAPKEEAGLRVDKGMAEPIQVNRYIVSKGDQKSLVLYWYQTQKRVIANEYKAKIMTIEDAIRYNRTDTALVRVIVPVRGSNDAEAQQEAVEFVQSFFIPLRKYLPS